MLKSQIMIKAILSDLDGVIRLWHSNSELATKELDWGLPAGAVLAEAFEKKLLHRAITGQISDPEWRAEVEERLATSHPAEIARAAVQAWSDVTFSIDGQLLDLFAQRSPETQLVLITNATSRLGDDLAQTAITEHFDVIINSSEVGVAKPDAGIFQVALEAASAQPHESLFIDDSRVNVEAANHLGLHAHHYQSFTELRTFMARFEW